MNKTITVRPSNVNSSDLFQAALYPTEGEFFSNVDENNHRQLIFIERMGGLIFLVGGINIIIQYDSEIKKRESPEIGLTEAGLIKLIKVLKS